AQGVSSTFHSTPSMTSYDRFMAAVAPLELFLCGDVAIGRGIDQILEHPSRPGLHEPYIKDARDYVELAEAVNGSIPRRVGPMYPWGDVLELLERERVDARIVNLETSITSADSFWPGKGI